MATSEPDTLIPGKSGNAEVEFTALFTPLVGINSDGSVKYLQAISITSSNDAKTWTVKIRPGWTFQNGEPVTATSYVNAWNQNAYGPNGYAASGQLANVVGYDALNPAKGKPTAKAMSGLTAVDDVTIRIELTSPDSQLPFEMTANQWGFYPLPKAFYTDPAAYNKKPIGDGPYEMSGVWRHDESIPMTAYPDYAGSNKPKTKNLTFKIYSNSDTAYTDVQAGATDVAAVPPDKLSQYKSTFAGHNLLRGGQNVELLGFPLYDKQWQNADMRRAISMAIDRDAINKALFGGAFTPADSFLPDSLPGGNTHSCQYCTLDVAKAKQLLAAAGGFPGTMVITYIGGFGLDQEYQAIANQIRQNLGIKVEAHPSVNFNEFQANLSGHKYIAGPVGSEWSTNYPSAQNILTPLFTPAGAGSGLLSATNYTSPAVTQAVTDANKATDPASATRLYQQAEKQVMDAFPSIPLFFDEYPLVYSNKISNVSVDHLTNLVYTDVTTSS